MQICTAVVENQYTTQIYSSITDIDETIWNTICSNIPFYKTHQFLSIVEEVHKEIQFRYVVVKKQDAIVAVLYMQLLDFSFNNLVRYSSNSSNGIKNSISVR